MFCINCGARIKDEALFCPKCGHRQMPDTQSQAPVQPKVQTPDVPQAKAPGTGSDFFRSQAGEAAKKSASYARSEVKAASSEAFSQASSYVGDLKNAFVEEKAKMKDMFKGGLDLFKSGGKKN